MRGVECVCVYVWRGLFCFDYFFAICGKYKRLPDNTDSPGSVHKATDTDSTFVCDVAAAHVEHKERENASLCQQETPVLKWFVKCKLKENYCILFNIDLVLYLETF